MPRVPPRWGPTSDERALWHEVLARGHPGEVLDRLLRAYFRVEVLPSFRFTGEPVPDFADLARQLAMQVGPAIILKLARRYRYRIPDGTKADLEGLLRSRVRADAALDLVGQARSWTMDRLRKDLQAHPAIPLARGSRGSWRRGRSRCPIGLTATVQRG